MKKRYIEYMQMSGFTEAEAKVAYNTLIGCIQSELANGDGYARITGVGSFKRKLVPQRQYSNPQKREDVIVKPAHYSVAFSLSKTFKASMPTP